MTTRRVSDREIKSECNTITGKNAKGYGGFKKGRAAKQLIGPIDERKDLEARFLDLQKAYPRFNKPALLGILQRYGFEGKFLETIQDLHDTTAYHIRGKDGENEEWYPERGLRERCLTSPVLFNVYHDAVMRIAERARIQRAEREDMEDRVIWKWMPGDKLPDTSLREKYNSNNVSVNISLLLFADDTTIIGNREELETGVKRMTEERHVLRRAHTQTRKKSWCLDRPTAGRSACFDAGWDQRRTSNKESEEPEDCEIE